MNFALWWNRVISQIRKWLTTSPPTILTMAAGSPESTATESRPVAGISNNLLRAAMGRAAPRAPQEAIAGLLALPPDNPALASPARAAALIGQAAHESSRFTRVEEGLYYSAQRLTQVFPRRFATLAKAEPFARNPQALANNVYGGRLGNDKLDDGWMYRGRGYLQLTGRENYRCLGLLLGLDLEDQPDLATDPKIAWLIASKFLATRTKGGKTALEWADEGNVEMVTRIVNGGTHGLDERIWLTALAGSALV